MGAAKTIGVYLISTAIPSATTAGKTRSARAARMASRVKKTASASLCPSPANSMITTGLPRNAHAASAAHSGRIFRAIEPTSMALPNTAASTTALIATRPRPTSPSLTR